VDCTTDTERIRHTNSKDLATCFELFQRAKSAYEVKSANVWNIDETGIALGICANHDVIGTLGSKRIYAEEPENRESVSILERLSASGGNPNVQNSLQGNVQG
jgi:hypothetical protein